MNDTLKPDLAEEYLGAHKAVNQRQPTVSVCVPTYQHAPYIAQCLDSILMQETTFPFEILIGEDDSSDGTREICKRYAEQHPNKIRLFLHARASNYIVAGQPTGTRNFLTNVYYARGEYIAFCDGDDYWTSPRKLQKQYEALGDSGCLISFHAAYGRDAISASRRLIGYYGKKRRIIAPDEVFPRYGSAMPMHSIMVSESLKAHMLKYGFHVSHQHGFIQALAVCTGKGACYLPETMGVYRVNSPTSMQKTIGPSGKSRMEWAQRSFTMLSIVDQLSNGQYAHLIAGGRQYEVALALGSGKLSLGEGRSLIKSAGANWLHPLAWKGMLLFIVRRPFNVFKPRTPLVK